MKWLYDYTKSDVTSVWHGKLNNMWLFIHSAVFVYWTVRWIKGSECIWFTARSRTHGGKQIHKNCPFMSLFYIYLKKGVYISGLLFPHGGIKFLRSANQRLMKASMSASQLAQHLTCHLASPLTFVFLSESLRMKCIDPNPLIDWLIMKFKPTTTS